jgi:hypothetical protein
MVFEISIPCTPRPRAPLLEDGRTVGCIGDWNPSQRLRTIETCTIAHGYMGTSSKRMKKIVAKSVVLYCLLSAVVFRTSILTLKALKLLFCLSSTFTLQPSECDLIMQPQSNKFTFPAVLPLERC